MLLKCCAWYVSKFEKLNSGQRAGKGQFSFQAQRSEVKWSCSVMSDSLQQNGLWPARLLRPWDFLENTGMGCHFLPQGIFLTQGSNLVSRIAGRLFTIWATRGSQSQRRTMPQNVQTTVQLCSFHMLARLCSKSSKIGFSSIWTENFQMYKLGLEKGGGTRDQIASNHWIMEKARKFLKKHLFHLH